MGLRVLSLNVKGLRDPQKVTRLKWYLSQIEFDSFCRKRTWSLRLRGSVLQISWSAEDFGGLGVS